jgi:hypothetical protein
MTTRVISILQALTRSLPCSRRQVTVRGQTARGLSPIPQTRLKLMARAQAGEREFTRCLLGLDGVRRMTNDGRRKTVRGDDGWRAAVVELVLLQTPFLFVGKARTTVDVLSSQVIWLFCHIQGGGPSDRNMHVPGGYFLKPKNFCP